MKEVTINAEIHHGEYRELVTASAENIVKTLAKLGEINSYCTQTEQQIGFVLCQLIRSGKGAMGWVNYYEVNKLS